MSQFQCDDPGDFPSFAEAYPGAPKYRPFFPFLSAEFSAWNKSRKDHEQEQKRYDDCLKQSNRFTKQLGAIGLTGARAGDAWTDTVESLGSDITGMVSALGTYGLAGGSSSSGSASSGTTSSPPGTDSDLGGIGTLAFGATAAALLLLLW